MLNLSLSAVGLLLLILAVCMARSTSAAAVKVSSTYDEPGTGWLEYYGTKNCAGEPFEGIRVKLYGQCDPRGHYDERVLDLKDNAGNTITTLKGPILLSMDCTNPAEPSLYTQPSGASEICGKTGTRQKYYSSYCLTDPETSESMNHDSIKITLNSCPPATLSPSSSDIGSAIQVRLRERLN